MKKYGHAITRLEDTKVVESQRAPEVNKDMIIVKKVPVKTCNLQTSRHKNGKKETKMFSLNFQSNCFVEQMQQLASNCGEATNDYSGYMKL